MECAEPCVTEFKSRMSLHKQKQEQLSREHQQTPFSPWNGLLVIRFSDDTTIQTNWTKLASPLEKMRRDGTTVVGMIELEQTDERQRKVVIGGSLIPFINRKEVLGPPYFIGDVTRMMNEQNGRVYM